MMQRIASHAITRTVRNNRLTGTRVLSTNDPSSTTTTTASPPLTFWDEPTPTKGYDRTQSPGYDTSPTPASIPLTTPINYALLASPPSIPVRHSNRQIPGPVCPPEKLWEVTDYILDAGLGDLLNECGGEEEGEEGGGLEVLRERLEYVLRGHAANVPHSRIASLNETEEGVDPRQLRVIRSHKSSDGGIHVEAMNRLVERMENEGELYLKQKYSKVMVTPDNIDEDDEEELEDEEEETPPTYPESNPCVSTLQYELLLDALSQPTATLPTLASLTRVSSILTTILSQHATDGGVTNVNFHSVPTVRAFNAAIRHSVNMECDGGNEKERDGALQNAFTAFDALYQLDACVKRNDETYALLLKVVSQRIPTSRSKGNVLRSLYEQCKDEGVVSARVLEVLMEETGNSTECDDWIKGLGVEGLTPRQTMNVKRRRIN